MAGIKCARLAAGTHFPAVHLAVGGHALDEHTAAFFLHADLFARLQPSLTYPATEGAARQVVHIGCGEGRELGQASGRVGSASPVARTRREGSSCIAAYAAHPQR